MKLRSRLSLIATVLFASSALAAPETGTRLDKTPLAVDNKQIEGDNSGRVVTNQYARCIAETKPDRAIAALALMYLSGDQNKAVQKLASGLADCLGPNSVVLRFPGAAMTAAMAEYFVTTKYDDTDFSKISELTEEAMFASTFKPRNDGEDFAQCVARSAPVAARNLLDTAVASDAEAAAIKKVVPYFGPCLLAGQDLKINADTVRSISAVGLYRILSGMAVQKAKGS